MAAISQLLSHSEHRKLMRSCSRNGKPQNIHSSNIVGFDIYLKDCWYWPADVLEDVLSVVSVDVCPFSTGMPALEKRLSIPNEVAYMPQLGTAYHTNMVSIQQHLHAQIPYLCTQRIEVFCH